MYMFKYLHTVKLCAPASSLAPSCTNEDFPGLYVHSWTWDTVKDSHFIFKCTFKGKMNDFVISWLPSLVLLANSLYYPL